MTSIIQAETCYSPILGIDWNYSVYLPSGYESSNTYPTLYLMHGAGGNHRNLIERFPIKNQLDELISQKILSPLIVVFIDGFNSFYTDLTSFNVESAIINNLLPHIETTYSTNNIRYIGGVSMGGYGAARLALKYDNVFSKALLICPALWYEMDSDTPTYDWHVFRDEKGNFDHDLWQRNHPVSYLKPTKITFFVMSGTHDEAVPLKHVERFVDELKAHAPVEFKQLEGGDHSWPSCDIMMRHALQSINKDSN